VTRRAGQGRRSEIFGDRTVSAESSEHDRSLGHAEAVQLCSLRDSATASKHMRRGDQCFLGAKRALERACRPSFSVAARAPCLRKPTVWGNGEDDGVNGAPNLNNEMTRLAWPPGPHLGGDEDCCRVTTTRDAPRNAGVAEIFITLKRGSRPKHSPARRRRIMAAAHPTNGRSGTRHAIRQAVLSNDPHCGHRPPPGISRPHLGDPSGRERQRQVEARRWPAVHPTWCRP